MMKLSQLTVGQRGRVDRITDEGSVGMRLLEMGLTPGVELKLVGTAPFGDPLEFDLRGYRLSLRKSEAEFVDVAQL